VGQERVVTGDYVTFLLQKYVIDRIRAVAAVPSRRSRRSRFNVAEGAVIESVGNVFQIP